MIEVYIDGASAGDPGPSGAGIFIRGHGKGEQFSIPLGQLSNHEAEYMALLHALEICLSKKYTTVSFRTDSQLIERAIENRHAKNEKYLPLLKRALELIDRFDLFFIKWIPGSQNNTADLLAKKAVRLNGD
ncbi:reverse transcriptase-like protein [Metabacillus sp. GX 13764]|uniref:reverse transcriptase-like protein n=1 Tax=Metabacillus kandeliae TaxID=2900151 RepID=UPI001E398FF9|nr:reverse transcriptase-like protein [Metabacillus kandeliae]MCD7033436.1 reverse transcriptase-like protein [Metabacillus kandeliae]